MKFFKLALLLLLTVESFAQSDCKISVKADDVNVEWVAYKTPSKVGVGGKFRSLGIPSELSAKNWEELFNATKFSIDSASLHTRNTGRDAKILKYFFQPMLGGLNLTGGFKYVDKDKIILNLKMNGIEQNIPMSVSENENSLDAKGVLDIYDFSMKKSLLGINQACYELHEGKTWNDVDIKFSMKFTKTCK